MNVLRDLSVILLAAEAFILTLIPLALFGGLVYGMWWLLKHENLPTWLRMMREGVNKLQSYVEQAMRAVVEPILVVNSTLAKVQGWLGATVKQGGD